MSLKAFFPLWSTKNRQEYKISGVFLKPMNFLFKSNILKFLVVFYFANNGAYYLHILIELTRIAFQGAKIAPFVVFLAFSLFCHFIQLLNQKILLQLYKNRVRIFWEFPKKLPQRGSSEVVSNARKKADFSKIADCFLPSKFPIFLPSQPSLPPLKTTLVHTNCWMFRRVEILATNLLFWLFKVGQKARFVIFPTSASFTFLARSASNRCERWSEESFYGQPCFFFAGKGHFMCFKVGENS